MSISGVRRATRVAVRSLFAATFLACAGCSYDWTVAEKGQDAGDASVDAADPVCQAVLDALEAERPDLTACNPSADPLFACATPVDDECSCGIYVGSASAMLRYTKLVDDFAAASCTTTCDGCVPDNWIWRCVADSSPQGAHCVASP